MKCSPSSTTSATRSRRLPQSWSSTRRSPRLAIVTRALPWITDWRCTAPASNGLVALSRPSVLPLPPLRSHLPQNCCGGGTIQAPTLDARSPHVEERRDEREHFAVAPDHAHVCRPGKHCKL